MRLWVILAIWVGLSGQVAAKELRVAVDIAPIHSIVAQVMGDVGQLDLIVPVGASPHDHSMRPSEAYGLSKADVVIWVGEGLTPMLEAPIATLAPDARVIELLHIPQTLVLPFREGAGFGAHSHGETDDHNTHSGGDPHVWLDPENAILWARLIAKVLSEEDSTNAQLFNENAENFVLKVTAMSLDIQAQLLSVLDKPFIVFHDAFHAFENRFGIEARGAISDSDAVAPSPKRVAQVRDLVKAQNVQCVLAEPQFNQGLVQAVAGSARVVAVDAIGVGMDLGPDLYEDLLRSIGAAFVECLKD